MRKISQRVSSAQTPALLLFKSHFKSQVDKDGQRERERAKRQAHL